jgi:hypothetical protein
LYAKEGQVKEEEIYSNTDTSPEYDEFLDFLGDRINLQDWPHFKAGLDTKSKRSSCGCNYSHLVQLGPLELVHCTHPGTI